MMDRQERRLAALEARQVTDNIELGVLFIPADLSRDEAQQWIAARTSTTATGPGVVVLPRKGAVR